MLPGDILVVEILDLGALKGDEWGFTGTPLESSLCGL